MRMPRLPGGSNRKKDAVPATQRVTGGRGVECTWWTGPSGVEQPLLRSAAGEVETPPMRR